MNKCYKCNQQSNFTEWSNDVQAPVCIFCLCDRDKTLKPLIELIEQLSPAEIDILENLAEDLILLKAY